MRQLVFDDKFQNITYEKPNIWKSFLDIPFPVMDFINNTSNKMIIYSMSDNKYYCSVCFHELDNYYCSYCKKKYPSILYQPLSNNKYLDIIDSMNRITYYNYRDYYVFDVLYDEVYLYIIREESSRLNLSKYYNRSNDFFIEKVFLVQKDFLIDLGSNNIYYYKNIENNLKSHDGKLDYYFGLEFYSPFDEYSMVYKSLYTDNFEHLKYTIYQYTDIWDTKDFLYNYNFDILSLTFEPLYHLQFEYLVKYRLYHLAYEASHLLVGNNFKEIFGVEKSYLSFMQSIDIDYWELLGLQLSLCKNKFLIGWLGGEYEASKELLSIICPNMDCFAKYLESFQFTYNHIPEYLDYIKMVKELGYDLSDKNILYPSNFMEEHDRLSLQYEIINNPNLNKQIKSLSNFLDFNIYEDSNYLIFPARSLESMIEEGSSQHNCLRTYISKYSSGNCQIYFMRKKNNSDKSFVTIEVKNNKIVQARAKFNEEPQDEIMKILRKWEMTLLSVENEEIIDDIVE